jgi:aminoglycoside phosphotransferase family enzyme/predicted kinase
MSGLIEALRVAACYPHPVEGVEIVETHISWVLLAGGYAYKIKKPVRLPFLDFGTLAARRRYCEEELRLNRRTAPDLYLDVQPIVQTAHGLMIGAPGEPIEYALRMRRFASEALADALARNGNLGRERIDAIAASLADFHSRLQGADVPAGYGSAAQIAAPVLGNFEQLAALGAAGGALSRLRAWTERECTRLAPVFDSRLHAGRVRECHGDLHLGNIAFIDGSAVLFDCVEFDPALRWIDVMSEVAFVVMDLHAHRLGGLAWRLLNAWLDATGDYEGVNLLRFYCVYRAMVRAKIACIRGDADDFEAHLALAESFTAPHTRALILMHGVSGSGKTTVSQALLERLGAVRVRSDLERKRLHGLEARARSAAGIGAGIYDPAASGRTYGRLASIARGVIEAGYPAIVDAAFLRRAERDRFREVAREIGARCLIASCTAPEDRLRQRVARREAEGMDASDAGAAVLARQIETQDALAPEERLGAVTVGTAPPAGLDNFVRRLSTACA